MKEESGAEKTIARVEPIAIWKLCADTIEEVFGPFCIRVPAVQLQGVHPISQDAGHGLQNEYDETHDSNTLKGMCEPTLIRLCHILGSQLITE